MNSTVTIGRVLIKNLSGRGRRIRFVLASAMLFALTWGLTGCQAPVPDREDLENAVMRNLTVTMAPKVERAIVTQYKCRVFAYGLPAYGQSTRCNVTYHFIFKIGVTPSNPNEFHRLLIMRRTINGWVALVNEASQDAQIYTTEY